ncbi:GvpL/GvpF family gas vesicle protein [Thiocapsa rosea]|uniref:Gas vesicle protein GvpL/GvpF n=1 Tax=Thiocapsa rosea TaxID=69360 RepID=A0A495VE69_9GAMM|nr:GvpL/GvpF family gas vesicle protein [Thiocapsa rosea]RKT46118.1 gas vesicle protein GvpL/GvpF [Thiocapsa rosea]
MQQAKRQDVAAGRYIYAIIPDRGDHSLGRIGLDESEVYTIGDGRVAAVVSDLSGGRIRPQRRNMAAHQEVLKQVLREVSPLPAAFGLMADDEAAIIRILKDNQDAFLNQLERVDGSLEMGLRMSWDVPNIFEYFVGAHPELQELRDDFFRDGSNLTQDQMITLGRSFERLLEQDREEYTEQVESVMRSCCREIKRNKCRTEKEVLHLACLVDRDAAGRFEQVVLQAARPFDNNYAFDFNGPWAPHNFVEMDIHV